MNAQRYRTILKRLHMTQVGAAKFLDVAERTSRRWASGELEIPAAAEMLLEWMARDNVQPNELREKLKMKIIEGLNNPSGNPQWLNQ